MKTTAKHDGKINVSRWVKILSGSSLLFWGIFFGFYAAINIHWFVGAWFAINFFLLAAVVLRFLNEG